MTRTLVLGGTTEASSLARALAEWGADAVFSYAGRTNAPVAQPLPTRIGGFGGVQGLVQYLQSEAISQVVDATQPVAAQMSANAVEACAQAGVALRAFERPPWQARTGDVWQRVPDLNAAVDALPQTPARVFLAIGKQNLALFSKASQHHYLLRLVDTPDAPLPLPDVTAVIARGPFATAGDIALLIQHKIDVIIAKNAGGRGAQAKLEAARELGVPVILVDRPFVPSRMILGDLGQVMAWLGHSARLGV
jgi:precorrin-6A/cobalt-precorrin-6A reductase